MKNEYNFDVNKTTDELIKWIADWFSVNGKDCNAVIGISGGKDSTIAAALCVKALGKDRVIGVLMPNGTQKDINDAKRICHLLGIKNCIIDISSVTNSLLDELNHPKYGIDTEISEQTKINLPPRIRMTTLYAIAQSYNGRVINTCNLSENICGFSTLFGDHSGDISLFDELTVTEIRQIGHFLKLPDDLVNKIPSDGLTGLSDEESFGFSYNILDIFVRTGICEDKDIKNKILEKYNTNKFKTNLIKFPHYKSNLKNYIAQNY